MTKDLKNVMSEKEAEFVIAWGSPRTDEDRLKRDRVWNWIEKKDRNDKLRFFLDIDVRYGIPTYHLCYRQEKNGELVLTLQKGVMRLDCEFCKQNSEVNQRKVTNFQHKIKK